MLISKSNKILFLIRLPIGGFRPINPPINRSSNPQRTSIMTLSREANNIDIACSTGNSTVSSNLSDTRILREVSDVK